jgi:predicted murein hydrolase (TIGR00659 family)
MNNILSESAYFGFLISIAAYVVGEVLKKKCKFCNPLLISIIIVILLLKVFKIDYEIYNNGAQYISYLLTPATVCLAIPLYKQINILKTHFKEIIIGICSGVFASMGSVFVLAYMFSLSHEHYVTLLPKSITTAIGIGLSEEMGGITTITIAVIIVTGVLGNLIAEYVLKLFRIKNPVAKGLAIGTASHAIGTTKAMEMGDIEGAMSSLAVAVAGLITVVTASIFANLI